MTISNQTGETLVAHNEERNWGIWYLGGKDKSALSPSMQEKPKKYLESGHPKVPPPAIRASVPGLGRSGSLTLSIEVPYSKRQ